jgi:hypothetical protein
MCTICKKIRKGSISIEEAREELDEQSEYLNEEHIEEVEELLYAEEDAYDYIRQRTRLSDDGEINYDPNAENYDDGEDDLNLDDEYDLEDEDE